MALLYMKEKNWYLMSELWMRDLVFILLSFSFIFLFHCPFILFWVSFSFSLFWTWAKNCDVMLSLLSLLLSSYIVVPIRELANTLYSFASKHQNSQLELSKYYSMNIEIDMHREHSASFCCGNHLSQGQMISLTSKPLNRVIMWEFHKRTRQGASS